MLTPAALLPLIASIALAPAPVSAATQADDGARMRSIEITHAFRATRQTRTFCWGDEADPHVEELTDMGDRVARSAVFFRDRPAPPLLDAPQDDAAAYFRTIDLGRRMVTSTYRESPPVDLGSGYMIVSSTSPLEGLVLRVRPTLRDAALISEPCPGLKIHRALEVSLVDARLPHLVAFVDGEPGRLNASTADLSVISELHAMARGPVPDRDRRPYLSASGVLSGTCWNQVLWEPIVRTITCVVDAGGRTVQRTTETPLVGSLALEIHRQNVRVATHMGWGGATGDTIETIAMEIHGTLSLTVDVRSGEAVALCLDLFCQVDRTYEAPEVDMAGSYAGESEGVVTLRVGAVPPSVMSPAGTVSAASRNGTRFNTSAKDAPRLRRGRAEGAGRPLPKY